MGFAPSSSSYSSSADEKPALYELRENPKRSLRFADPVFAFSHSEILVQDRESETESKNPTRKRSKRSPTPAAVDSPANSVSDTSPEEDVAMCLMMLSRDSWVGNEDQVQDRKPNGIPESESEPKSKSKSKSMEELGRNLKVMKLIRRKKKCEKCRKQFRSYKALFSHEKICRPETELESGRIFKCPFCLKLFGSGQALGGHKRSHLATSTNGTVNVSVSLRLEISLIDLNLPAPVEEDDYSVVSYA
ncbi:zinc finger protein ZAT9 [Momordica charantia]|uniref:Zinc finger protein ZAT9 n=1 Tax=Momordica charantia TaxID=3673 RepID=A0A6J1DN89_MOMCH|nr:zinc finger protein ZAT9 [Momordica charantia]